MINKFKYALISLAVALSGSLILIPAVANADFTSDACSGVSSIQAGACTKSSTTTISHLLKLVINVLSMVVGFAAVVMIIFGGFKFITAQGDANSISQARSSLIYSIVGLAIVAVAQSIVHFVLAQAK